MCIYYVGKKNLKYAGKEHIFPAALGGIEKLPTGYVSDQANNFLSKLENNFIHNCLIVLSREFFGPGKRGSNKPGAKQVYVHISGGHKGLCYLFEGKPYLIESLIIEDGHYGISGRDENSLNKIIKILQNFYCKNQFKFVNITDDKLNKGQYIIGFADEKLFIASSLRNIDCNRIKELIKPLVDNENKIHILSKSKENNKPYLNIKKLFH